MVQVTVTGGLSQFCQILYSEDLVNWALLTTVSLNAGNRFYRARGAGP